MNVKTPIKCSASQIQSQNAFLDVLRGRAKVANDARLCKVLGESVVVVSRCRNGTALVGSSFVLRVLEAELMTLAEIRMSLGPDHPFNAKREAT